MNRSIYNYSKTFRMKLTRILLLASITWWLAACSPDDRSDEQPFPPTVETLSSIVQGDAVTLQGHITASPNSSITRRGFRYGSDNLQNNVESTDSTDVFAATIDSLEPGNYHVAAYATNGLGTSDGDTLTFVIE